MLSYHYAAKLKDELRQVDWDQVVIDEAQKLRNAYLCDLFTSFANGHLAKDIDALMPLARARQTIASQ